MPRLTNDEISLELGAIVKEYGFSLLQLGIAVLVMGALAFLGGFWIYQALFLVDDPPNKVGLILGSIVLVLDAGLIVWALCGFSHRVTLCEKGFASQNAFRTQLFRWTDIACVHIQGSSYQYYGAEVLQFQAFTVVREDGQRVELNSNLAGVQELGQTVLDNTLQVLFPQVWQRFEAGELLNFGKLKVSQAGFQYEGPVYPWSGLQGTRMGDGELYIDGAKGLWCSVSVKSIPNIHVFLHLLNVIASKNTSHVSSGHETQS